MSIKVEQIITDRILEAMQKDKIPVWQKPWTVYGFRNAVSKKTYKGVNILMLSLFGDGEWYATFNQIKGNGGTVKKGSKAIPIVYWNILKKENKKSDGTTEEKKFAFLKYFNVFPLTQTEGTDFKLPEREKLNFTPIETAEQIVSASGAIIIHKGERACYSPALHCINMPAKESFKSVAHYYATLFHELMHWASKDVGVKLDGSFGSDSYNKEELTAEIGSNFLLNYCGIDTTGLFDNSISYINNWMQQLGKEPKLIIGASSQASKRFELLTKLTETEETQETMSENTSEVSEKTMELVAA